MALPYYQMQSDLQPDATSDEVALQPDAISDGATLNPDATSDGAS